jgi:hypothetical protein
MSRRGGPVAGSGGNKKIGTNKETEKLIKLARKQGWTVEVTGGNHLKWTPPPGSVSTEPEICGLTPVSVAFMKLRTRLVKKGLNLKP